MTLTAPRYIGDTVTLQQGAWMFTATMVADDNSDAPWDREDGHGPVSGWTTRDKRPGEVVLSSDGKSRRLYDYQHAVRLARRDGWDAAPYNTGGETKRQQAAKAALADYRRLRDWCNDEWSYVGFVVTLQHEITGVELASASLWDIESDCGSYGDEVCLELIAQCISEARETLTNTAI